MSPPLRILYCPRPHRRRSAARSPAGQTALHVVPPLADLTELIQGAMAEVAALVSARGLCAREAARLAHIPAPDFEIIASACKCAECAARRTH